MAEHTEKETVQGMQTEQIHKMVKLAYHTLDEKKAENITVIDISNLSVVADYFIIASGENQRQTEALCGHVEEALEKAGFDCRQIEGKQGAAWILMDYGDVIIHIFDRENRLFYDLERIWKDGHTIVDVDALN